MANKKRRLPKHLADIGHDGLYFHAMLLGKDGDAVSWAARFVHNGKVAAQNHGITKSTDIDDEPINLKTAIAYAGIMAIKLAPNRWRGKVFCDDFHILSFFVDRKTYHLRGVSFDVANGLFLDVSRLNRVLAGGNKGSNLDACYLICRAQLDLKKEL